MISDNTKDKKCFLKTIYEKYSEDIYKVSYYICKDKYIAEEIVQDTFIRAYTKLDTLDNPDKVKSWLITIASNLTKKKIVSAKKNILYSNFSEYENLVKNDTDYTLDLVEYNESKNYIKDCIIAMEPEFREVLILYYYDQLSYAEIAEKLNIRLGTVKSRLSRAKKKLKEKYHENHYA